MTLECFERFMKREIGISRMLVDFSLLFRSSDKNGEGNADYSASNKLCDVDPKVATIKPYFDSVIHQIS